MRSREREREGKFSRHHSGWYAHRMKVVLHQLVAWSWSLVIFYCILPCPVHNNRPKKTTASEFKEVYNVPYTSMAKNKRKTHISKQYHSSSYKVHNLLPTYKFDSPPLKFLTLENELCSELFSYLISKLMSTFWNKKWSQTGKCLILGHNQDTSFLPLSTKTCF